jgi:CTP:molybdopterin cytidylyltransferase MocA
MNTITTNKTTEITAIITVAGYSNRFNESLQKAYKEYSLKRGEQPWQKSVNKCIFKKYAMQYSLLENQILTLRKCGVSDFIIVTGNRNNEVKRQVKNLTSLFNAHTANTLNVKFVYNQLWTTTGSCDSFFHGIRVAKGTSKILFVEGDLYFDEESMRKVVEALRSGNDVFTYQLQEPIIAERSVIALFTDTKRLLGDDKISHNVNFIYDSSHKGVHINVGYRYLANSHANTSLAYQSIAAIYNSAQIWGFACASSLRSIAHDIRMSKPIRMKTNLEIVNRYFGALENPMPIEIKDWHNVNTVEDLNKLS